MNRIGTLLPILGFSCFVFVIWKYFDYGEVWECLKKAKSFIIILVIILTSIQIFTATLRYKFFLKACGTQIKTSDCMSAVLTALSLNSLLPGKSGDLVKGIVLTKEKDDILKFSGVTMIEKLCDLSILSVITFIGSVLVNNSFWQFLSLTAFIIFICSMFSFRYANQLPIIGGKLQILPDIILSICKNRIFFLYGIFFCILLWIINLLIIYLLFIAVDANVSASEIISYWPSSMLTGMLPITISGFGTRDAAFIYAIGESLNNTKLFAGTFLYTVFVYWFLSILAFLILVIKCAINLRSK